MRKERTPQPSPHTPAPSHSDGTDAEGRDVGTEACHVSADQLAAYTDALLAKVQPEAQPEAGPRADLPPELARAVEALAARAEEADVNTELAPARRRRLKADIMAAWDAVHTPWPARVRASVRTQLRSATRALTRQPAWRAAAALLLLAFGVLLLVPLGAAPVTGTAVGPLDVGLWVGLGLLVAGAAVVIWLRGRRR
jgi:hypothetical protein